MQPRGPGDWARHGLERSVKIVVDRERCTGLGICESYAPDVFEVNDEGELVLATDEISSDLVEAAQKAVASCPTEALRLEQ